MNRRMLQFCSSMAVPMALLVSHIDAASSDVPRGLPDESLLLRKEYGLVRSNRRATGKAIIDEDATLEEMWEREARLAQIETAHFFARTASSIITHTPTAAPVTRMPTNAPASPIPTMLQTTTPIDSPPPTAEPTIVGTPERTPEITIVETPDESYEVPSLVPSLSRECLGNLTIQQFLVARLSPITNPILLLNAGTPQGAAFQFLLDDTLVLSNLCEFETLEQRYGLATFYFSTNGRGWTAQDRWLSSTSECLWQGVTCTDGIRASNLTLGVNNLNGPIPNEVSTLYRLGRMELFGNALSSTIPDGIANLTSLEVLDLEQNAMSGTAFPSSLLRLTSLKQLFLSRNDFTGTISGNITDLINIQDFWIAENQLSGPIPASIGDLRGLKTLIMYDNNLESTIPSSIGQLTNMTNLQLYSNELDGSLPSELFGMTQLSVLLLNDNLLGGTIQPDIGFLSLLTDLRLHSNDFQGIIPEEIIFLSSLRFLTLGENFLDGVVPNVLSELAVLENLDLGENFLTGPIPDTAFALPAVTQLYFHRNNFTGPIPPTWSSPPLLIDLFLNDNSLTGTIPNIEPGQFSNLEELTLQYNQIVGTMPDAICALRINGKLGRLFTDCGGADPKVDCLFPSCCNLCFEGDNPRLNDQGGARRLPAVVIHQESGGKLAARHSRGYIQGDLHLDSSQHGVSVGT